MKAALEAKAEIVVICSSDEEYAALAPAVASAIRSRNKEMMILVAGYPKEIVDALKSGGVDDFIHIRTNVLEFLRDLQKKFGML
jgi:methylmalonyl-CoA mutase